MNIISVSLGRRTQIDLLKKYLDRALSMKIIHEVHFWNNSRGPLAEYVKTISNLRRTCSSPLAEYIAITPVIMNNSFVLMVKAPHDVHIRISDTYEIVLGGWGNTRSCIRAGKEEVTTLVADRVVDNEYCNEFQVNVSDGVLYVSKNNRTHGTRVLMSTPIEPTFVIEKVEFKTGFGAVGTLYYTPRQHNGFYFMDTCESGATDFYNFYTGRDNDVVIKCDDDIVFMDIDKLPRFITFVRNSFYDVVFANIINDGVAVQNLKRHNLIPSEVGMDEVNDYFIDNYETFLDHPLGNVHLCEQYSAKFFGYKTRTWSRLRTCAVDEGYKLSVEYRFVYAFKNVLYGDFYVAHGDSADLYSRYSRLFDLMEEKRLRYLGLMT